MGLLLLLAAAAEAQQTDVIRGRVTNEDGHALRNVRVRATSIPGNVTREARTDGRGNFQIVFPNGTGDYMMGYALIGYLYRQQQIKRHADEDMLIANMSLTVMQLDTVAVVAPVRQRIRRGTIDQDMSGTEQHVNMSDLPPEARGDFASMAGSLPGILLAPGVNGGPAGFSVFGLGADQNSISLNGVPTDATGFPRDANVLASISSSPYDVARGGFSGAQLNLRTMQNAQLITRGVSMVLKTPRLQWTDRAGRALGNEFTNVSVGGVIAGPISQRRAAYNISYQLGHNSRDNQTLLRADPLGLRTAGIASDSVTRLLSILQQQNVPGLGSVGHRSRVSDNGSLLADVDFAPPGSATGQSLGLTLNGSWGRQSPVSGAPSELASASGDRMNWSGGVQARHSGYLKLVLSETSVGVSVTGNNGDPYLQIPGGRVRVNSELADGASGVQTLTFGGNQSLSAASRTHSSFLQNSLSWFDEGNKHRVKLSSELRFNDGSQDPSSNMLGTFTFNSLQDLQAGIPASFSRTLRVRRRETGHYTAAISIGDSYRHTQDLQFQYGVRFDATRYRVTPELNPGVLTTFGRRNDRIPNPIAVSPRFGFTRALGEEQIFPSRSGEIRPPRAVLRGGVGVFASTSDGAITTAIDNTGLPTGTQQILCVGPAAPVPDWDAYHADPASIPDVCADGTAGSSFSSSAPNVSLFAPGFRPPRSVRSNIAWSGAILDARFIATFEASHSLNLNQQRQVDLNFDNVTRFTLDAENRPVFVSPASIVPATGSLAARDARVSDAFSRVTETLSDLRSEARQISIQLRPVPRQRAPLIWTAGYSYTHLREKVSGFSSTAGSPLGVEWARSAQGPHQFTYSLGRLFAGMLYVAWNGSIRSGAAFTPMVVGDVNGDGQPNDRAFVFSPATAADPAVGAAMAQLIAGSSDDVGRCLTRQLERIAERNSCRGPWTSTGSLSLAINRATLRLPYRTSVSFAFSNPLGAIDLLVNGSDHLKGWGQPPPTPDPQLLYVRGFDAATREFRYEVNQRFGAARPRFNTLRAPVMVTMTMRMDIGPARERQLVEGVMRGGRDRPGYRVDASYWRRTGRMQIPNPIAMLLREQDTLGVTPAQADSLAVLNRQYVASVDSLWAEMSEAVAAAPPGDVDRVYALHRDARHAQVDMLILLVREINSMLTPQQRRRLSPFARQYLDVRLLRTIRKGSSGFADFR